METQEKARILLVDDEPDLVRLLQTYLSRMGYVVDTGVDAPTAFAAVKAASEPYDLLVSDVTLPGMSGKDMALQMLADNPELRVLLCSGYPVAVDSLPEEVQDRFASLQKPFNPNMLAEALRELLQRRGTRSAR